MSLKIGYHDILLVRTFGRLNRHLFFLQLIHVNEWKWHHHVLKEKKKNNNGHKRTSSVNEEHGVKVMA